MAHDDAVFERRPVEQHRGDGLQGVEPATGLVDGFRDEVRREVLLKFLLVLKGIVPLGEGHGAGVVPAVDNLLDPVHLPAALGAFQRHGVDEGPVQLDVLPGILHGHLPQLRPGSDDVHVSAFAFPNGQGGAPVALPAQAPVDHVLQEVAHPAFLDVLRHPVHGPVVPHQLIPHRGHLDEPGGPGVVQQGRVAPPAEGIVVGEGHRGEQQAPFLQILQDQGIRILDEGAGPVRSFHEPALGVHQVHEGQPVLPAYPVVVLAVGRRDVHDAGAVLHGNVVVAYHEPGLLVRLLEPEQGFVFHSLQALAGELLQDLNLPVTKDLLRQGPGHDVGLALSLQPAVGVLRVHAQGQVAGQGPGGGGPGQQVGILLSLHLEADEGGGFLHVLVSLGYLVAAQGGAAAGAVRHDLVALVQHALLVDLLQAPPFGLDIVVVIGDVGMLHVDPVAHLVAHLLPFMQVFPYAFLAFRDKGLDAVFLDLGLSVQPQALLHLQLDRQAVGVPSGDAQGALPLHRLIPRDQILDHPGFDMADMRLSVGRGRSVEKGELRIPVPQVEGFADDVLFLPHPGHFPLPGNKIHVGRYFRVHLASFPFFLQFSFREALFRLGHDLFRRGNAAAAGPGFPGREHGAQIPDPAGTLNPHLV